MVVGVSIGIPRWAKTAVAKRLRAPAKMETGMVTNFMAAPRLRRVDKPPLTLRQRRAPLLYPGGACSVARDGHPVCKRRIAKSRMLRCDSEDAPHARASPDADVRQLLQGSPHGEAGRYSVDTPRVSGVRR